MFRFFFAYLCGRNPLVDLYEKPQLEERRYLQSYVMIKLVVDLELRMFGLILYKDGE